MELDADIIEGMKRGLAYLRDYDKIVSELREPIWYAIEYIGQLESRCNSMADYLKTHDHTKHAAAMAAAREHLAKG